MKQKLKVVWLCHFSNADVRKHLPMRVPVLERFVRNMMHNPSKENSDFAQWNTNAIREFEKFTDDIDLYVVAPFHYLTRDEVRFDHNGIHYYFFKDKLSYLGREFSKRVLKKHVFSYSWNRKMAVREIERIKPDIVHLIGAENPYYGLAALDLPKGMPLIVQLQTLLSNPKFKDNYFMDDGDYYFRQGVEMELILRADYIGTTVTEFIPLVKEIKPDAVIVPTCLAVTEPTVVKNLDTAFDFVYFANSIDKAADVALEAFAIAHSRHPSISLDIVGSGSTDFVGQLHRRILELNLANNVVFEGRLATHEDVITQIRKARFALLPLKIDLISGTIREAMANGLPVVTTVTPATPSLNEKRESVLLSQQGDYDAMALNMCKLLEDEELAKRISDNALLTSSESSSNTELMNGWKKVYLDLMKDCTN